MPKSSAYIGSSIPPASTIRLAQGARSWQATADPDKAESESNGAPSPVEGRTDQPNGAARILRVYPSLRRRQLLLGSAQDLDSRVKAHNDGRGAAHTFKHRPVQLVYS